MTMFRTLRALRFLFVGPVILLGLVVINLMTSPHHLWVKWAALGIGSAWVVSLLRVLWAALLVGGVAALWAILYRSNAKSSKPGSDIIDV